MPPRCSQPGHRLLLVGRTGIALRQQAGLARDVRNRFRRISGQDRAIHFHALQLCQGLERVGAKLIGKVDEPGRAPFDFQSRRRSTGNVRPAQSHKFSLPTSGHAFSRALADVFKLGNRYPAIG